MESVNKVVDLGEYRKSRIDRYSAGLSALYGSGWLAFSVALSMLLFEWYPYETSIYTGMLCASPFVLSMVLSFYINLWGIVNKGWSRIDLSRLTGMDKRVLLDWFRLN